MLSEEAATMSSNRMNTDDESQLLSLHHCSFTVQPPMHHFYCMRGFAQCVEGLVRDGAHSRWRTSRSRRAAPHGQLPAERSWRSGKRASDAAAPSLLLPCCCCVPAAHS